MKPRGFRIAMAAMLIGVATIMGAAVAFWDQAREQWYIWKLGSPDLRQMKLAAERLGEIGSVRSMPHLFSANPTRNEGSNAIQAALLKIAKREGERAVPCALVGLQEKGDGSARFEAASILGLCSTSTEVVRTALRSAMHDPVPQVRAAAASSLSKLDPIGSLGDIEGLLSDPSPGVRYLMAQLLGNLGPAARDAVPELKKHLNDLPPNRQQVIEAIQKIEGTGPIPGTVQEWIEAQRPVIGRGRIKILRHSIGS